MKQMAKTVEELLERKKMEKMKNYEFIQQGKTHPSTFNSLIEKNIIVNRDNQILLNKLVDISHGKWVNQSLSF